MRNSLRSLRMTIPIVISRGLALKKLAPGRSMEMKERNMRKRVILTGPRITPEETARLYGLSKRHAKRLIDMVEKSLAKRSYSHLYYGSLSGNKNGDLQANARGQKTRKTKSSTPPRRKSPRARRKSSH